MFHLNGFFCSWTDSICPCRCPLRKTWVTIIKFEGLRELIKIMPVYIFLFLWKSCSTNVTFEGLLSFMNWFNVSIQTSFSQKSCSTNVTFKVFFSLWTDSPCLFRWFLLGKPALQSLHLNSFSTGKIGDCVLDFLPLLESGSDLSEFISIFISKSLLPWTSDWFSNKLKGTLKTKQV